MRDKPTLLYFADEQASAERIAQEGLFKLAKIERHRFPDGELKLRLPETLPAHVCVLRTLNDPNEKLIELLLTAKAARQLGARFLTLVAPYLAYMRQDIAFNPGEAVSQRIVGRFLADLFDAVITVDPHLHRISRLQEAVPVGKVIVLSGALQLSDLIAARLKNPLLLGPDQESEQWIAQAASRHGFDYSVCSKVRHGDHSVVVSLPAAPIAGRQVVLLDDIASTGQTLAHASRLLIEAGAVSVHVAVTHALLTDEAMKNLLTVGVRDFWSTDCIAHPSNAVSMAASLAEAVALVHENSLIL